MENKKIINIIKLKEINKNVTHLITESKTYRINININNLYSLDIFGLCSVEFDEFGSIESIEAINN